MDIALRRVSIPGISHLAGFVPVSARRTQRWEEHSLELPEAICRL